MIHGNDVNCHSKESDSMGHAVELPSSSIYAITHLWNYIMSQPEGSLADLLAIQQVSFIDAYQNIQR